MWEKQSIKSPTTCKFCKEQQEGKALNVSRLLWDSLCLWFIVNTEIRYQCNPFFKIAEINTSVPNRNVCSTWKNNRLCTKGMTKCTQIKYLQKAKIFWRVKLNTQIWFLGTHTDTNQHWPVHQLGLHKQMQPSRGTFICSYSILVIAVRFFFFNQFVRKKQGIWSSNEEIIIVFLIRAIYHLAAPYSISQSPTSEGVGAA